MDHKQIISRDSDCPTFKSYVYWQNNMLHRRILLLFWFSVILELRLNIILHRKTLECFWKFS
ncbi:hypothetical protein V1478_007949 [Vespula squamosa]|uniref:Uncharacterized protein n=1 Tax=Vespula squamosa TaxID=30214 RepID=A0ABD2AXD6_VESSQ